jgi:hypothetical protein
VTGDPERRSRLLAIKLGALVDEHAGSAETEPGVWHGGAALIRNGDQAWVLADDRPQRALGPAMAWALRRGGRSVDLLAESATGVLARRAAEFADPPRVWLVEGRTLLSAVATPYDQAGSVPDEMAAFEPLIRSAGAEVVVEHGVLCGEVLGLEVCRAVADAYTGAVRLEVGVGAHDREAFQLLHGDIPPERALQDVVELVARHRAHGASPHPLNRLAAERAVRSRLLADPAIAGAARLTAAPPPVVRTSLKDPIPCVAAGETVAGEPLVVVCSVGIDLDLVPFAADARAALGDPAAHLVLALPARDAHELTAMLAARLRCPATIVTMPA